MNDGNGKIQVTALDPQFGAKLVELDAGATLADLSAALGKQGAENLPAMDGNGQHVKPTDVLADGMSIGYSFKVAGA